VELAEGREWKVLLDETYRPPAGFAAPRVGGWIVLTPGTAPIVARVAEIVTAEGDPGTLIVDRPVIR
jgi:hypothetical protein